MQDQRTADEHSLLNDDYVPRAVFDLVVHRHPALVGTAELLRELAEPTLTYSVPEFLVLDAVTHLIAAGLVHQVDGRFLFASHTAMQAHALSQ